MLSIALVYTYKLYVRTYTHSLAHEYVLLPVAKAAERMQHSSTASTVLGDGHLEKGRVPLADLSNTDHGKKVRELPLLYSP